MEQSEPLDATVTSPLKPIPIAKAAGKCGFDLSTTENMKYKQYSKKCSKRGNHFVSLDFESFWGKSTTVRKTFKLIALLADSTNLHSAEFSQGFGWLSQ